MGHENSPVSPIDTAGGRVCSRCPFLVFLCVFLPPFSLGPSCFPSVVQVYEGDLLDEERHGTGEYRYADGTVYSGEWHRGQRQGFGTLVSPSGALYEGG